MRHQTFYSSHKAYITDNNNCCQWNLDFHGFINILLFMPGIGWTMGFCLFFILYFLKKYQYLVREDFTSILGDHLEYPEHQDLCQEVLTVHGSTGSGKTLMLRALADNATPGIASQFSRGAGTINKTSQVVATNGANIINITKINPKKPDCPDTVSVREIGGTMSPIWGNFVEPGRTQVIYVVDSSSPEKIGPSTVDLIQLMSLPALKNAPFLIVFTKTDLSSAVTVNEIKSLMRLEDMKEHTNPTLSFLEFNTEDHSKIEPLLNWCLQFKNTSYAQMNGNAF